MDSTSREFNDCCTLHAHTHVDVQSFGKSIDFSSKINTILFKNQEAEELFNVPHGEFLSLLRIWGS
jgi:hypothetical protein